MTIACSFSCKSNRLQLWQRYDIWHMVRYGTIRCNALRYDAIRYHMIRYIGYDMMHHNHLKLKHFLKVYSNSTLMIQHQNSEAPFHVKNLNPMGVFSTKHLWCFQNELGFYCLMWIASWNMGELFQHDSDPSLSLLIYPESVFLPEFHCILLSPHNFTFFSLPFTPLYLSLSVHLFLSTRSQLIPIITFFSSITLSEPRLCFLHQRDQVTLSHFWQTRDSVGVVCVPEGADLIRK